jgi:hypothetical protein
VFVFVAAFGPAALAPAQEIADDPVLLILDASGSMNRASGSGGTLMDAAKDALRSIVVQLPGDAEVGLRVYGHRTSNQDQDAGCVDTELLVPVGAIDRVMLLAAVDDIEASGFTPIGLSLTEAVNDLEAVGGGTVILISDGVDTCAPPDPCEVAAEMAEAGYVTRIHTLGFFLSDSAAERQLECIAEAGNGSFSRVDEVESLFSELSDLVTGAPDRATPVVQGALERQLAPVLEWQEAYQGSGWQETLTYLQTTMATGETRWFAVDIDDEAFTRSQMTATATIDWQPTADPSEYFEIRIFDESGAEVGVEHAFRDVVVLSPQRLVLVDAADFAEGKQFPEVETVTDPQSAPPAWEVGPADDDWFAPTRERWHNAGMNGAVYELWKRLGADPGLDAGRYYVALSWQSERSATAPVEMTVSQYRGSDPRDQVQGVRAQAFGYNDAGFDQTDPARLDPVDWVGPFSAFDTAPLRSVEVMSAIRDNEPRYFELDLSEGERLVMSLNSFIVGDHTDGRIRLALLGPDGHEAPTFEMEPSSLGDELVEGFVAPSTGSHLVSARFSLHGDDLEQAMLLSLFVFPEDFGGEVGGEGPELAEGDAFLMGINGRAMMAGFEAVRIAAGQP